MSRLNRWKMADHLNVFEICLLMAGYDPESFKDMRFEKWENKIKNDTLSYLTALQNAVIARNIDYIRINSWEDGESIDWYETIIDIQSMKTWIKAKGFQDGFFIVTDHDEILQISDSTSEFYASKLAAAVKAWTAVSSNPSLLRGKSPRKAIEDWLHEHAMEYGLINKDGKPNKLGIEEISKVANWKQTGGAPATPTIEPSHPKPIMGRIDRQNSPTLSRQPDHDDEIPF